MEFDERKQKIKYLKKLTVLFASFTLITRFGDIAHLKLMGVYIVIVSLLLMMELRKNVLTFMVGVFIAWFNYSIVFANYFSGKDDFFLTDAYNEVSITGLRVLCCFITCVYLIVDADKGRVDEDAKLEFRSEEVVSSVIAVAYLLALCFILLFGFAAPSAAGERGSISAIYEYSILLFIIGYYLFWRYKWYMIISSVLMMLFVLQNVIYGERATALQELIIFYVLFINKKQAPDFRKLLPLGICGVLIFTAIGMERANFSLSSEQLSRTAKSLRQSGMTLDTAYSAYFCSLTFIKTEVIIPQAERIKVFFNWFLSMFIGTGMVGECNVPVITRKYFMHYYGGVLPFYGHFHFGYIGTNAFSVIPAVYLNIIGKFNQAKGAFKCVLLYFVVTAPRWYLYSPSPLIRGALLMFVLYFVTLFADKILQKKDGEDTGKTVEQNANA